MKTPDRIWLVNMGDEVVWHDDPRPTGYEEAHDSVEYVRVGSQTAADRKRRGEPVEDGWRLIAVNEAWDALERALSRACNKGYMPVAMGEEWDAFDWTEAPQPVEQQPDVSALVEALEDIGASWHGVNTELERYMRNVARLALAAYRKGGEA